MDDIALMGELRPVLARLFERHLATTKEWFPHALVPWDRGAGLDATAAWNGDAMALPRAVRSALFVNLLTEDNLPYYFETLNRVFADEAWREWARRWTAEEMRHAIVIRDYVVVSGALDPIELERARMAQVTRGQVPQPLAVADGLVYVALQELATRIAHRNTGKLLGDPAGYAIMSRVASDENLHYLLYRDLVSAALEVDPSATMCAIERQVRGFEMPGTGIPDFTHHAAAIAAAEIYDLAIHHEQIQGLSPDAEAARVALLRRIERTGTVARKQAGRRARRAVPITASVG